MPLKKTKAITSRGGPTGYTATSRKDKDGRKVYTKGSKDYVKRKKPDGTFGMRQVVHKKVKRGGGDWDSKYSNYPLNPHQIRANKETQVEINRNKNDKRPPFNNDLYRPLDRRG
jgi:hypothetical protein